jgi:hypothetical protein
VIVFAPPQLERVHVSTAVKKLYGKAQKAKCRLNWGNPMSAAWDNINLRSASLPVPVNASSLTLNE